ncbi:hypothetical protein IV203_021175 [Nitzschia inconspicua]|uniref:Uncharacterized protein n=1 Tax=Nitzschia inconspicua TaxID=303405 RepID=A0A9K3KHE5_9STRA|nr:hypothetical protein IV203_021175 [Nitzschia inconspicua]
MVMFGWNVAQLPIVAWLLVSPNSKETPLVLSSNRRDLIQQIIAVSTVVTTASPYPANAEADTGSTSSLSLSASEADGENALESLKPFAPVSALLPATRARLWIEEAYQISTQLRNNHDQYHTLERLDHVLSHRPTLFRNGEKLAPRVSSTPLAQFTAKRSNLVASNRNQNVNSRDPFASGPSSLADKVSMALNQADVARQWGILQAQESRTESQNELRAAWNYYTQQLEFNPSSYEWTASAEEKKRRIRSDELPTPQVVIVSDLDLRDLYRNQMLTALDDVYAEVQYQLKQGMNGNGLEVTNTIDLMDQAHGACNKWFDMIDKRDVEEAQLMVQKEQYQNQHSYSR